MVITTDSVLAALKSGTYTLLSTDNIFKTQQPEKRRRYPSLELLETPLGNTTTQEKRDYIRKFDVRIFLGLRGGNTTGQEDEISNLEKLEVEIQTVLDDTQLGEHKIIIEDKKWNRQYMNNKFRPYIQSFLTITIRQVTGVSNTSDGVLVFDLSNSIGDSLPTLDYTYTQTYNTDITDGFNIIDEFTTQNHNPKRYTGNFSGTMITHIRVKSDDLGTTTDKLNQLRLPQTNQELPIIGFIYTNKDETTPTPNQLKEIIKCNVSRVDRMYKTNDNTIFRLLCNLLEPSILS